MKKRSLTCALVAATAVLSGCSMIEKNPIYGEHGLIKDRNQEYEKARVSKPLVVPEHVQQKDTADQLVIPSAGQTAYARTEKFEVPRPEFFYADTGSESVNLKKVGDMKVIVVDEPIASVWEKTLDFMQFNGMAIANADARTGTIESDWILVDGPEFSFVDRWVKRLTFQDIPGGTRNKFQISLRPDPHDYQRTAIEMRHAQFPKKAEIAAIDWQAQSQDVGYQSDVMFEMLRYMSKATAKPTERSLLALQSQRARPLLGRDSRGNPVMKIEAPIDQSWALLNQAVDRAGLDVGTRDQSTGMMYMTYTTSTPVDRQKEMGFFEWLFSDRGEIKLNTQTLDSILGGGENGDTDIRYSAKAGTDQEPVAEGEVQALADPNNPANQKGYKIWFAGRVIYVFGSDKSKGNYNSETDAYEHVGKYQLKLNRSRSGVFVTVLNSEGLSAPAVISEEILWAIKDQMPAG